MLVVLFELVMDGSGDDRCRKPETKVTRLLCDLNLHLNSPLSRWYELQELPG